MNQLALIAECFPGATVVPPDLSVQVVQDGNDGKAPDVLSHVGIYWRKMNVDGKAIDVAGIGAVCTDPEHRSQGHATHLLEVAHRHARREGIHFAALFSDYDAFYCDRLGYCHTNVKTLLVCPLAGTEYGAPALDLYEVIDEGARW